MIVKLIACLVAASVLEIAGVGLQPDALLEPTIVVRLLPSFLVTFLILTILEKYNRYLDARFDWMDHPRKRFIFQILLGGTVLFVSFFSLIVIEFFFKKGVNIYCMGWLIHMALTSFGIVMFANAAFVTAALYQKLQQADRILKRDFPNYSGLR